jgi:ribosomal protein S1
MVDALVLTLDVSKKRISLSMKRLEENPLDGATASTHNQRGPSPEGISDKG